MTDTNILAPELLPHVTAVKPPVVGELVVVIDHAGREIGGRLEKILGDGDAVVRVCGLEPQAPYSNGEAISRPMSNVLRAV